MNSMLRLAIALLLLPAVAAAAEPRRPNVLVILADDLGFSDLGCYGGEIDTPHLDALAAGGLRFTQGYQTARCWPSRAALLTGYYPQAVNRDALPGGKDGVDGTRPAWARLLPELLAPAGYRSYHSGKWHVDGDPRGQGFAHSLLVDAAAQSNYFTTQAVTEDGRPVPETADSYVTTLIGDHAVQCLRDHAATHAGTPFFHYVAFTAPHFPLHAPAHLIAKYRERYQAGWDAVRAARIAQLAKAEIVTTPAGEMERGVGLPYAMPNLRERLGLHEIDRPEAWANLTAEQRAFQAEKMAIHAAMVEAMDREVGRIVTELKAAGLFDDTFILFASDNGASAEMLIRGEGHDPAAAPGSRKTFLCLGPGWSSCANTPFRRHKMWNHEGGIATPWIVHWPKGGFDASGLRRQPVHLIDVAPTVLELAGVEPPATHAGLPVPPMHGRSFVKPLRDPNAPPIHDALWWCHGGNRAIREGDWKLVADRGQAWELYDLAADRCETTNIAATQPDRVRALEARWTQIADECRTLAATAGDQPRAAAPRPPNVVIVFCDDLGYGDPSCYGGKVPTPNIDRIAREGIRFTDFHVPHPVCSASRAALLTGCYSPRVSIHGALAPSSTHGIASTETTLAELLRDRGYRTACVGKWHLGHLPEFLPTRHGFDEWLGLPYSNDMWPPNRGMPPLPLFDGEEVIDHDVTADDQATLTGRYTARAVDFIERTAKAGDGKPFFLYLAHTMPHVPLFVGEEFRGKSAAGVYGDVVTEIDTLIASIDILPTVAALTGDPLTDDAEGYSLVAGKRIDGHDRRGAFMATEPPAASDAVTHLYYYKTGELQAVRRGRWKLMLPHTAGSMAGQEPGRDGRMGKPALLKVGRELYDLEADVAEQNAVAAKHPEIVAELEQVAEKARRELGDSLTGRKGAGVRPPGGTVAATRPRRPPSVLVILSDDQRADTIHALGNEAIRTPALDALAARGTVFTRAFCMGSTVPAVCIPSRAMLLSGRSLFHVDLNLAGCDTWPEAFGRVGYRTFVTGKWHNNAASLPRCFAEGDAVFLGGLHDQWAVPTVSFRDHGVPVENERRRIHSSELFGGAAENFINRLGDEPFFAWLAFTAPHDPRQAPDEFRRRWEGREPPPPANFLPEHPFDNGDLRVRDETLLGWPRTRTDISRELADYHACVEAMDVQIGRVVAALEAKSRLDDTLILFTSDQGLAIGSHGLLGKQNLYEHSMRSPAILAGPGVPAGQRVDALAYLFDLTATVGDLAAVAPPERNEGKSLMPVIRGETAGIRDSLLLAYKDVQRALVTPDWKLIDYPQAGRFQLFDVARDPDEIDDRATDPAQAARLAELKAKLAAARKAANDPLR